MNLVCLTGQVVERRRAGTARPGWIVLTVEVPRRRIGGAADAGVQRVAVVLPPGLAADAQVIREPGEVIGVMGMLSVETDHSVAPPRVEYAILADAVESVGTAPGPGV
jgi:hypothetical protein